MTPYQKAMLALARKFYPVNQYHATDEQLLKWLAEDARTAAQEARSRSVTSGKFRA